MAETTRAQDLFLLAAKQASEDLVQCMRAVEHGEPGEDDTIELLADAVKLAIEAEHPDGAPGEVGQLHAALVKFLEGWAG
jgi:hypothetical protein